MIPNDTMALGRALIGDQPRTNLAVRSIPSGELQRNRTDDDCAIAATANLLSLPYERASAAFARPVDPGKGIPSSVEGKEPAIWDVSQVIERLGHPNQVVLGPIAPQLGISGAPVAPNARLRSMLDGRAGIVMELDQDHEGHCLVWRAGTLTDPRAPGRRVQDFNALDLIGAVILN